MNPPPLPLAMRQSIGSQIRKRLLGSLITFVILTDFLLWNHPAGISFALLLLAGLFLITINRGIIHWDPFRIGIVMMILGAAFQAGIAISTMNILLSLTLLLALAGDTFYEDDPNRWSRWMEMMISLVKAPGQWGWVFESQEKGSNETRKKGIWWMLRALTPAILLGILFAPLLASGNAVVDLWMTNFFARFSEWIWDFDFTFGRILFWMGTATGFLACLHPAVGRKDRWIQTESGSVIHDPEVQELQQWRTGAGLIVVNLLFGMAITADILFLWWQGELPAGVTYSQFVHEGVTSLIIATLLSGAVMIKMFPKTFQSGITGLRWLGYLWILQNVLLLLGVFWRLKLYVSTYQLTLARIHVGIGLLAILAAYGVMFVKIAHNRGAWWWFRISNLCIFLLFYGLQFADLESIVAEYNVCQWLHHSDKELDLDYLKSLGSSSWPALRQVAESKKKGLKKP